MTSFWLFSSSWSRPIAKQTIYVRNLLFSILQTYRFCDLFMNYMSIPTVQCGQVLGQAAWRVTQKTFILHILWMEEWYHRTIIFSLYHNSMEHRSRALWSISYDTQVLLKPTLFIPNHAKFLSITTNILYFFFCHIKPIYYCSFVSTLHVEDDTAMQFFC